MRRRDCAQNRKVLKRHCRRLRTNRTIFDLHKYNVRAHAERTKRGDLLRSEQSTMRHRHYAAVAVADSAPYTSLSIVNAHNHALNSRSPAIGFVVEVVIFVVVFVVVVAVGVVVERERRHVALRARIRQAFAIAEEFVSSNTSTRSTHRADRQTERQTESERSERPRTQTKQSLRPAFAVCE